MIANKWWKSVGLVLLCLPLLVASPDAWAKKKKKGAKKGNKGSEAAATYVPAYGMAGCGLGSVMLKEDSKMSQTFAGTTNGSSNNQTFAISTGSSNCRDQAPEAALRIEQEVFVAANLRGLEKDVSAGGGEYTEAFAEVLGCHDEEDYEEFLETSRAHFEQIFASADAFKVYAQYIGALRANPKLAAHCERVVAI